VQAFAQDSRQGSASGGTTRVEPKGESKWGRQAHLAFEWFLGRNDLSLSLYDPATGERAGTVTLSRVHLRADSIFVGLAR